MMEPTRADYLECVQYLRQGKIVAYPTEAVYGLGCDPFNADAVANLLHLKHRAMKKGFILIAASWEQVEPLVEMLETKTLAHVLSTWPGPHTWAFPAKPHVPEWIRGVHKTVAIRVIAHPIAKKLCEMYGGPIVSTSANISDYPPIRDYRTMQMSFGDKISMILPGKVGGLMRPTSIRHAVTGEILRD